MRTLTINHEMIDALDTDAAKLEFANNVISMFKDAEPETKSLNAQALYKGLNRDLPSLRIGVSFDTKNMGAAEVKRYHMVRSGYVPLSLDCRYEDYEYRFLDNMSDSEVRSFIAALCRKISHCKNKRDYRNFLWYMRRACSVYCIEKNREDCLTYLKY